MFQNEREIKIPTRTFASMLRLAMREAEIESYSAFEKHLIGQGIRNISEERIREYCNLVYTPSFEKAKLLFDSLEFYLDEEDIGDALRENRKYIKDNPRDYKRKDDRELRISVRIKLSKLIPRKSPQSVEAFLFKRIEQLCGDGRKYTEYIQALIAKDLQAASIDSEFLNYIREDTENEYGEQ